MKNPVSTVEDYLAAGDVTEASDAFGMLRPAFKSSLEGLKLSARIHFAAGRWEQVGVLCRILRKEYPTEVSGFTQGAESLYHQGRSSEAIEILKEWQTLTSGEDFLEAIDRYRGSVSCVGDKRT